jgi:hypothetical protein
MSMYVTLKMETIQGQRFTTIKLIGRIETEHLDELQAQLDGAENRVVFDLGEVSLVNLEVVRFLGSCEAQGVQLANCSAYVRKWIDQERGY